MCISTLNMNCWAISLFVLVQLHSVTILVIPPGIMWIQDGQCKCQLCCEGTHSQKAFIVPRYGSPNRKGSSYKTRRRLLVISVYCVFCTLVRLSGMIIWVCYSIYLHAKPQGCLMRPSAITKLTVHFTCGVMSALVICKQRKECGHTWHPMYLLRPCVLKQQTQIQYLCLRSCF